MIKIHRDIWNKVRFDIITLCVHSIRLSLRILIIFLVSKLIILLFSSYTPILVNLLIYISDITMVIYFVKVSIQDLFSKE